MPLRHGSEDILSPVLSPWLSVHLQGACESNSTSTSGDSSLALIQLTKLILVLITASTMWGRGVQSNLVIPAHATRSSLLFSFDNYIGYIRKIASGLS